MALQLPPGSLPNLGHHVNLKPLPPNVAFRETIIKPDGTQTYTDYDSLPGELISLSGLKREAEESSESISKSYVTLNSALKRYEDLVRMRWSKKTRTQRRAILEKAWHTDIPTHHRPDLLDFRRGELELDRKRNRDKNTYMWPHINLEDLLTPATIPRFLNSRGRNSPCVFANIDWDSTGLGREAMAIRQLRLDAEHTYWMVLETDDLSQYGAVKRIDADDDRNPNATRGLIILEIQERVMEFLVKVCEGILHDKELDLESLKKIPEEPEPPMIPTTKEGVWPSAIDLAIESPYLVPQALLLDRVESLIQSRLREWEDYAWSMREDPAFFVDVVGDWSEHSSTQIQSPSRKAHPDLASAVHRRTFWDRTIFSAINEAYENLVVWNIVCRELKTIKSFRKTQVEGNHARPGDVPGYVEAVQKLKLLLDARIIEKLQRELGFIFPSSPPMRSMFQRHKRLELRSEVPKNDYLLWLGLELYEMKRVPPEILAMELNRVVQHDKKEKDRVTPMVARFFADLGIAYELRSRLRMICPHLFDLKQDEMKERDGLLSAWSRDTGILALYELKMIVGPSHAGKKFLSLGDLGAPPRLPYPINKKRTKDTVETMQVTERNLDELWAKHDEHLKKHLEPEVNALLQSAMPSRGELQRTKDWVEPRTLLRKTGQPAMPSEYVTPSDSGRVSGSTFDLPIRKDKAKTRGLAEEPSTAPTELAFRHEATLQPEIRLKLGKKAYHTLSTLFHKPSTTSQPGEVPWTDFLSAMGAIGFQPEKLYGSVWRFTPKHGTVFGTETPINFHEPHPVSKLPFKTARMYGRRLARHYGVGGGSFVLGGEAA
ncbi:hypothetical protein EJ02DRAFT_424234 [Clathrospora elynae]|uniref:Uncharacterized protein n=1 Tax=Clathrospora elynae TaxID=706981 RepID=A0A6A5SKG0_9PLEO|nr:hypothetical protein EJ02DRAFT_424234 [Clathrospora elynae]